MVKKIQTISTQFYVEIYKGLKSPIFLVKHFRTKLSISRFTCTRNPLN